MRVKFVALPLMYVALRKESVDRNAIVNTVIFCIMGRSPQGERG